LLSTIDHRSQSNKRGRPDNDGPSLPYKQRRVIEEDEDMVDYGEDSLDDNDDQELEEGEIREDAKAPELPSEAHQEMIKFVVLKHLGKKAYKPLLNSEEYAVKIGGRGKFDLQISGSMS
jgi:hypothetical protein